jgi:hypothetical protein
MKLKKPGPARAAGAFLLPVVVAASLGSVTARPSPSPTPPPARAIPVKPSRSIDDSMRYPPAADLQLDSAAIRQADALANFVEGARLEQNGEIEAALTAYQKVLTVHPGEIELASRVASLLTRQKISRARSTS